MTRINNSIRTIRYHSCYSKYFLEETIGKPKESNQTLEKKEAGL